MKRRLQFVGLVVAAILLAGSRPARAGDIWDYLEQLSGAGPFHGKGTIAFTGGCLGSFVGSAAVRKQFDSEQFRWAGIPYAEANALDPRTPCFFFEKNFGLSADPDGRFDEVKAHLWSVGVTFPIRRALEVGFGVGQLSFDSKGVSSSRVAITIPRVVIKPLFLLSTIPSLSELRKKQYGVLKFYLNTVTIAGTAGEDFGISNTVYDERGKRDWLTSVGFTFDLLELVRKY